jgi:hypothetical protein
MGWLIHQLWRGTWVGLIVSIGCFAFGAYAFNDGFQALPTLDEPPIEVMKAETIAAITENDYDQLYVVAGDAMHDSGYSQTFTTKALGFIPTSSSTSYYGVLDFDGYWLLVHTDSLPDEDFTVYTGAFLRISNDEQEMIEDLENYFQGEFLPMKLSERSQGAVKSDMWWMLGFAGVILLGGLLGFYRFTRRIFQPRSKANAEPAVTASG